MVNLDELLKLVESVSEEELWNSRVCIQAVRAAFPTLIRELQALRAAHAETQAREAKLLEVMEQFLAYEVSPGIFIEKRGKTWSVIKGHTRTPGEFTLSAALARAMELKGGTG
jgi:hypothetical protein